MNDLSWMIYLANTIGALKSVTFAASFAAAATAFFLAFIYFGSKPNGDDYPKLIQWAKRLAFTCLASIILFIALPSRDIIYAIAASEMGEEILQSKTGSKAAQALDVWLDRQIEGEGE